MTRTRVKLNMDSVKGAIAEKTPTQQHAEMQALQVAVYVMAGGGMLGRFAAEQPKDFYVDIRTGRLPYPTKTIIQAVHVLQQYAKALGLDAHDLPPCPHFHHCGVF